MTVQQLVRLYPRALVAIGIAARRNGFLIAGDMLKSLASRPR